MIDQKLVMTFPRHKKDGTSEYAMTRRKIVGQALQFFLFSLRSCCPSVVNFLVPKHKRCQQMSEGSEDEIAMNFLPHVPISKEREHARRDTHMVWLHVLCTHELVACMRPCKTSALSRRQSYGRPRDHSNCYNAKVWLARDVGHPTVYVAKYYKVKVRHPNVSPLWL